MEKINVLYSSDDNYAQHLGVSLHSLLKNSSTFSLVRVYIIDNNISAENHLKIQNEVSCFKNAEVHFISFEEWKNKLKLNMSWNISISSYARLFVAEMLPKDIDRVLYLDCDMIICRPLNDLWNIDLNNNVLGAVQDSIGDSTKNAVGLDQCTPYFNAGLLLINLDEWRQRDIGNKCIQFIRNHNGNVTHHDQGTLNGILKGDFVRLPLEYNLMTIYYFYNRKQILRYFGEHAEFYAESDIQEAMNNPSILHYTPSFTSRPWVKDCKHPLKWKYWENLKETSWRESKPIKNTDKFHVRLVNWRFRTFK